VPPFPVNIFPYIFFAYMAVGGGWLYLRGRRRRGLFTEIEADLDATLAAHEQRAHAPAGTVIAGPEVLPSTT
jgi:hypothetical protein